MRGGSEGPQSETISKTALGNCQVPGREPDPTHSPLADLAGSETLPWGRLRASVASLGVGCTGPAFLGRRCPLGAMRPAITSPGTVRG